MSEPGLDRHDWETQFAQLEEDLHSTPGETLPELNALVERMLRERHIDVDDFVVDDGVDPEIREEFRASRDVVERINRDEDVDPGDIASAINGLVALYQHLLVEYSAP